MFALVFPASRGTRFNSFVYFNDLIEKCCFDVFGEKRHSIKLICVYSVSLRGGWSLNVSASGTQCLLESCFKLIYYAINSSRCNLLGFGW